MGAVGVAKDIYLEKFGLDATSFSLLAGGTQRKTTPLFLGCPVVPWGFHQAKWWFNQEE